MNIKIKVKKTDIQRGLMGQARFCPIAIATKRATKRRHFVAVAGSFMEIGRKRFQAPQAVQTFVKRFDSGKSVEPFEFTIRVKKNEDFK